MLAASGFRAVVDQEKCSGCSRCVEFCQFLAIDVIEDEVRRAIIDPVKCMGCGVCVNHCSRGALSLVRDTSRGEPLEIIHLMEMAR